MIKKTLISFFIFSFGNFLQAQTLIPESKIKLPFEVNETSGIEWINDSIWITHNDSGDDPVLYFLNAKGELLYKHKIKGATNIDWEDITFDGNEKLYISDLGNNFNNRKNLKIHSFDLKDSSTQEFRIKYADQKFPTSKANKNFDCEAIAFHDEKIFTFTKNYTDPYNGICKYYVIDLDDTTKNLLPIDSLSLGKDGFLKNSVTSSDFSNDGKYLAILTYKYLHLFYEFPDDSVFQGKHAEFMLPEIQQREAICFDSSNNIWMTDEKSKLKNGGYLYKYELQDFYTGKLFFRQPEIGIVSIKTKKTNQEGIRLLQIHAATKAKGEYLLEILKNGKVIHSVLKESNGKIKEEINFAPDDTYTELFSVRIYKNNQLVYENKFEPFK